MIEVRGCGEAAELESDRACGVLSGVGGRASCKHMVDSDRGNWCGWLLARAVSFR